MFQENAKGAMRELVPDGHTVSNKVILSGAKIYAETGLYLGYWNARDMPRHIAWELRKELIANWAPGGYKRDAL